MKRFTPSVLFLVLSLTVVAALPALAQQDTVMNVQVDKTVAIPGHILLPGSYIFRIVESQTYPGYVQITSTTGNDFGFVQVFPSRRQDADGTRMVMSAPDQAGLEHVMAWYFPGERSGHQFIYSRHDLSNADLIEQRTQNRPAAGM